MPPIVAKSRTGYSRAAKTRLSIAISNAIGIEEILPAEWTEIVDRRDILAKPDTIFKQPGAAKPTR
jgi:hypothetical protein